jgi:SAM-dependent methyltransferase
METHKVRDYYNTHKEKIEQWLDVALSREGDPADLPVKVNPGASRSHRRFAVVRNQLRLRRLADLSRSKRVLDVGAGFGDFAIFADNFGFERLDATEPSPEQYHFITEQFRHYDRVYNLPLEEMDMSGYDTLVLIGLWVPDWRKALEEHILPNSDLRDVVMNMSVLLLGNHVLEVPDNALGTWRYCRPAAVSKLYSMEIINSVFRRHSFRLVNSRTRTRTKACPKVLAHYQRD